MSGIVGHTLYALPGLRAAEARKLPITALLHRHLASYLAGAYLGCDIQAMPEAICVETGEEVGFGTVPVEPIQSHYLRVGLPDGALGRDFGDGWAPEKAWLLEAALLENRRFLRRYVPAVLADMELHQTPAGPDCNETLHKTVGLPYPEMVELAQKANFRHTLWEIGEAVGDMFASVVHRESRLARIPTDRVPSWEELTQRWRKTSL